LKKEKILLLILGVICVLTISIIQDGGNRLNGNQSAEDNSEATLWNYTADNSGESAIPSNYQDYIMLDNPIIKKYADNLELKDGLGIFHYKDNSIFFIIPKEDENGDYWQNPDYTLKVKTGDCEDMALLTASFLVAKKVPAMVVIGLLYNGSESDGHIWVEYYLNGTYYAVSNFHSFKREIRVENSIVYYSSPAVTLVSTANESDRFELPSEKFQPRNIFGKNIKKNPYNKDWITLT